MRKFLRKLTSALTTLVIVGSNFMPALVYAANEIADSEKLEDVSFDATINDEHSYEAKFDEKLELNISLNVENNGYIKNGKITIENNNYLIGDMVSEEDNIVQVDKNTYEVNQVNSSESVKLTLPIEFEKSQLADIDYFNRISLVKLDATYIDANGEEKNINKTVKENIKWNYDAEANIKLDLKRYLKYDNKTLVSFVVTTGVNDNLVPAVEKTIQILVPILNEKEPSKVIVSGDNVNYAYQDQILIVNRKYTNDENKVTWNSNDEFLITYVYDTQIDETNINTVALMSLKTVTDQILDIKSEETSYFVKDELGSLLETSITGDNSINKGYMYTNLDRTENKLETPYKSNYQINIGLAETLDEIQVIEKPSENVTINKKISVNRDELVSILGEEGNIKVLDSNNAELGTLNKDNLQLEVNTYGLKYIISKPLKEGNLNITLDKIVNPQLIYTKEALSRVPELENTIDVIGILQGNEISNNHIVKKLALVEPTSNATITVDRNQLSTVIKNENVVITATLERNDITDALYENPELLITLPSQIAEVNLKDARLIYEDELVPIDFRAEGRIIYINMRGKQTKYSSIPTANGTVVRIVADLTLDNLTVNSDETISLQYTNRAIDNKVRTVEAPIKVVAPTGFVTANAGTMSQNITAITDNQIFQIAANDREKQINLSGIVVSNLNENATGFMILGRVPTEGTKTPDNSNQDLNATYTSTINSQINVQGIDADVYYSNNGEATYDLSNETNGWTLDFLADAKSYIIVAKGEIAPAQKVTFNYNAIIPRNLDYENSATSVFAVYYDNKSEEGISKNIISSKLVSINTENIPVIKTEITATDYYTGDEIKNGDSVPAESFIKYVIHATNTGKESAHNVKVVAKRPDNGTFYIIEKVGDFGQYNNHYDESEELYQNFDVINPGETKDAEFIVRISEYGSNSDVPTLRAEVTAENMLENSTSSFENNIIDGTVELKLSSTIVDEDVKIGRKLSYSLTARNHSKNEISNLSISIDIPEYLNVTNCEGGSFDERTRKLTFNSESFSGYANYMFETEVVSSNEPNQEITLQAFGSYDGIEKQLKSNKVTKYVQDAKGFTASMSSNIEDKMIDTDTVEYYITVNNNSKKQAEVLVYDDLPDKLKLIGYTVKNGNTGYTIEDAYIEQTIKETVQPGESLRVTVTAKPYILDTVGQIEDIENNVSIMVNGEKVEVNQIKQQIEGTSNFNTVQVEQINEEKENIYSISGKVWYDENSNSRKESEEIGMPATILRLYDVTNQTLVKNEDGSILEIYTNENGEYKFDNLSKGQYIILTNYDNESYVIANYQDKELEQNEDCDFISSNSKVATTNTITINGENIYNIDLGLVDINNFNITLTNTISKISVIDEKGTTVYDNIDKTNNIEINNIENSRLVIEYSIKVANEGNIEGYATAVENYIPEGMEFKSELNPDWYIDDKGDAINSSIANKLLLPGEEEEIRLVLIKDMNKSKGQLVHSEASIKNTYNKYGIEEIKTETNLSKIKYGVADIIVTEKENTVLQISLISISLLIVIGLIGGMTLRKYNKELKKIETI